MLTALPAAGYDGEVPRFPLPDAAPDSRRERELALWEWAWSTPQACAWSTEPWRWHAVAMWVRTSALCESADATAADKNSLHRFADQVGLTPAGLKENGWKVAPAVSVAPAGAEPADEGEAEKPAAPARTLARDRFKVVGGAA